MWQLLGMTGLGLWLPVGQCLLAKSGWLSVCLFVMPPNRTVSVLPTDSPADIPLGYAVAVQHKLPITGACTDAPGGATGVAIAAEVTSIDMLTLQNTAQSILTTSSPDSGQSLSPRLRARTADGIAEPENAEKIKAWQVSWAICWWSQYQVPQWLFADEVSGELYALARLRLRLAVG